MSVTILGLFDNVDDVAKTIKPLEGMQVSHDDIKLLSLSAYPDGTLFKDKTPTPLWKYALVGGFCGFAVAVALAGGTQVLMNLNVGGKAPFSFPVVGLISYEFVNLGAIIGSIIGFMRMTGLPDWSGRANALEISRGKIGLLVRCTDESKTAKVEEAMLWYGAGKIYHGRDDF